MVKKRALIFLVTVLLAFSVFFSLYAFLTEEESLRVVFFDVGQGDAIFIKTPSNHHILIDGGTGEKILEPIGRELPFFKKKIDLMVLTHLHDDHVAGLIEVAKRYDVDNIVCTGALGESGVAKEWAKIREEEGYIRASKGKRFRLEEVTLDVFYPEEDISNKKVDDLNAASVISRLNYKDEYSFLLTGDAYKAQEEELLSYKERCKDQESAFCQNFSLESDVLKVSHHGSKTSTSQDFLEAVSPEFAVIMAGEDNRHGHPHKETIELLKENDVKIKRTDKHGDIVFDISI